MSFFLTPKLGCAEKVVKQRIFKKIPQNDDFLKKPVMNPMVKNSDKHHQPTYYLPPKICISRYTKEVGAILLQPAFPHLRSPIIPTWRMIPVTRIGLWDPFKMA